MQAGSPSAYSAFTVNRHHTSIKQACECEIILFELMDNQTGTQFRRNYAKLPVYKYPRPFLPRQSSFPV